LFIDGVYVEGVPSLTRNLSTESRSEIRFVFSLSLPGIAQAGKSDPTENPENRVGWGAHRKHYPEAAGSCRFKFSESQELILSFDWPTVATGQVDDFHPGSRA
jgi:hypothetical protein